MVDWGNDMPAETAVEKKEGSFSMDDIAKIMETAKTAKITPKMCCLVLGAEGCGKSGIVLDYCNKLDKPTIVIDLDGGCMPLIYKHYKGKKTFIIPQDIIETKATDEGIDIDYIRTLAKINGIIKYTIEHQDEYGAIVLDGLSTLLKFCEFQSRIDKNIAVDGGMQLRYWILRAKLFTETIEIMKTAASMHRFYIGHIDLVATKDSAAVKQKLNALVHQRIICSREEKLGKTLFIGKIDKSKYNLLMENKNVTFATVNDKEATWDTKKLFEGLL